MTSLGDRIVLVHTSDPHTRLQPNALGTVQHVDSVGTVHILWGDGTQLGLVPDQDEWRPLHPRWDELGLVQTHPPLCTRCGRAIVPGCCDNTDGQVQS